MKIEKINQGKVSDKVFEQLKMAIISNELKSGEKIPSEQKLGEMFGVSRVTIRTALKQLSTIGLVEIKNGEGTFVCEPNVSNILTPLMGELSYSNMDMKQLMEFRQGIEMQACRFAAMRRTPEELEEMQAILEEMAKCRKSNDIEAYTLADMNFHFCIVKMSKNLLLQKVMSILQDFMLAYGKNANVNLGIELGYEKHWELYDLIKSGLSERAERLMYQKLQEVMEVLKW
ncbi:MAG: FadR family transcriptional regulator [Turicibacter sp.]|nr:FadR family transcriptional regulator [Turicibacter sp.]